MAVNSLKIKIKGSLKQMFGKIKLLKINNQLYINPASVEAVKQVQDQVILYVGGNQHVIQSNNLTANQLLTYIVEKMVR